MQNKKIDPLGDDVVGACADNFLKVAHFFALMSSGARLTTLKFAMHMNWLMFIGVEHDD